MNVAAFRLGQVIVENLLVLGELRRQVSLCGPEPVKAL